MKKNRLISIIIPAFNEEKTILKIINSVSKANTLNYKKEIIIINDGSSDNTLKILCDNQNKFKYIIINNPINKGKSYSIKIALKKAKGDVFLIQDADLEYNPNDIKLLLTKLLESKSNYVVYGSRWLTHSKSTHFVFYLGGVFLTRLTNFLYKTKITDEPTGYKMFKRKVLKNIKLESRRFGFCPEITAKVSNMGYKILEVPISYTPRNIKEGKKINLIDFIAAVYILFKYKIYKK